MHDSPFTSLPPHLQVRFLTRADGHGDDDTLRRAASPASLVTLRQVHSATTVIVREAGVAIAEADGMWTDVPGLALALRVADCQAFVAYIPSKNIFGVLHAGWKGLLNGAIPGFFRVLQEEWGVPASECLVGAAPSLCVRCGEFTDPVRELPGIDPRFFRHRHVDLQGIADDQLIEAGVEATNIERHPDCTRCRPDIYWSYRAEGKNLGASRNVLLTWIDS